MISLKPLTFEFSPVTRLYAMWLHNKSWTLTVDKKSCTVIQNKNELYLICSPLVLNKLITSHSSSDGDKLQASNSRGAQQKGTNCQKGVSKRKELRMMPIRRCEIRPARGNTIHGFHTVMLFIFLYYHIVGSV